MKKLCTTLLSLVLFVAITFGTAVSATDVSTKINDDTLEIRYEQLQIMAADIALDNGIVTATGSYVVRLDNPKVEMTITVQESSNGKSWEDKESWTYTSTEKGFLMAETCAAEKKDFYRVKVTVDIYYSNGVYIESGEACSASKLYI